MTNQIVQVFEFEGFKIRTTGTPDKPAWVASDVCKVLELDTSTAVNGRPDRPDSGLDDDEKGTDIVSTPGGDSTRLLIPISDRVRTKFGLTIQASELAVIGRSMAKAYRDRNDGKAPPKHEQFVGGATRMVNSYRAEHYEGFGDELIRVFLLGKGYLDIA